MNATHNGNLPACLMEAVTYFADLDRAHAFFVQVRWPDGVICPRCGSTGANYNPKYRRFQCNLSHDNRQFTVKTGSIMEDSPLGLNKWAVAFWLEVNAKNSISSYEVHRALKVTQKSAWFMQQRIRLALHEGSFNKMTGTVEADESFIGGLARNMHKSRRERVITGTGGSGKAAVMGLLERHSEKGKSKVRTFVVGNTRRKTLAPIVQEHVAAGSNVYTDSLPSYAGLAPDFAHDFVNHAETYVKGNVHTNGLENFWALFKRCIKGTHVSVEPFHLFRYLDAESFRFNNRTVKDGDRFLLAMAGAPGKRLTYKALIGQLEGLTENGNDAENANPIN
jgi:transposase-like protein